MSAYRIAAVMAAALAIGLFLWLMPREREEYEDERAEALGALQSWSDQRAYPFSEIPDSGFYRAHLQSRTLAKTARRKAAHPLSADTWKSLGPNNVGGRTIALAVDPRNANIVYAGAATGGLWRMTQQGSAYAWQRLETGQPVLGVNAIAIDPRSSRVLYIGTGEVYGYGKSIGGLYQRLTRGSYGVGILKSADSGATWNKSLDWSYQQQRGVLCLRIHPGNPDILFAGTSEGVFRSRDAGRTWQAVHSVLMAVDLAINPANPDLIFASCGNFSSAGHGLYRSQDGGDSWQKLAGGLPAAWSGKTQLAAYASPFALYADVADADHSLGLFRSADNGQNWSRLTPEGAEWADYQGWYSHAVRVQPGDNSRILFAGVQLYRSENSGAGMQTIAGPHLDHHVFADDPARPEVVYLGNDGGVTRSADGGQTWKEMNNGYVTTQFYQGFSSSARNPNLAIGGLQDNSGVMYTGSAAWRSFFNVLGGDGTMTAIHPQNDNIVYLGLQHLIINRSQDGGNSWQGISAAIQDDEAISGADQPYPKSCSVSPYALSPSQPATVFACNRFVNRSDDGGNNWRQVNGGQMLNGNPIGALGLAPQDVNTLYAATVPTPGKRAEVFASSNGGTSFRNITGSLPDRYVVELTVSPRAARTVYATLSGFGSSHVFRSDDGGTGWIDIGQGLPDAPTSSLAIDPANDRHLYVGNDLGVYASQDDGQSWMEWKEDMPTACLVMELSLSLSNRKIRAATHGNGVFERSLLPAVVNVEGPAGPQGLHLAQVPGGLEFRLPGARRISLEIRDGEGRLIRSLAAGRFPGGRHFAAWKERDDRGAPAVYFARLEAGADTRSLRLVR